ncbi:acyltransferase family protein [Arsukibacterium indicum]|uniref:Acyltransferase family protein n=1 Tax=Arsukibacterium indicum TaxID=2848612 RepID=A0ABS6MKK0_9GAMM|nr:acyltransferase family protein [Arsukibacterium indicum]MBV2129250.1 acyltransferase family protein [Arsukibacterium indicum]
MTTLTDNRRYDLDWLRTLAFGLLILYHIGMYYVADWGWHIKSDSSSTMLQNLMILTNPWRMSLLFFISAMALALAQQRSRRLSLFSLRSNRLLIPLLTGMFIVVVPQVYFEALAQQLIEPGFISFWWQYINPNTTLLPEHHSPIGLLTWNHLWFLPYLWCYSALVLLTAPLLNALAGSLQPLSGRIALLLAMAVLICAWYFLRQAYPSSHALLDDWYNHAKYFGVFIAGYLFALQGNWWRSVIVFRRWFLLAAIACYSLIIADRNGLFDSLPPAFGESVSGRLLVGVVLALNHWGWILALLGYAGRYLNRPANAWDKQGKVLHYANNAILPWYMLHQTLIIVFAVWLKALALPVAVEASLLIVLTCVGCWAGYELVKRFWLSRWLFGLKVRLPAVKAEYATPVTR